MCAALGCTLETTSSYERIKRADYDLLLSISEYIDPSIVPASVNILFGPQFFVFPAGPVTAPMPENVRQRVAFNALCPWVANYYREVCPHMECPLIPLPTGVDTGKFCPTLAKEERTLDCIFYVKHRHPNDVQAVQSALDRQGLTYKTFSYGTYGEAEYLAALRSAKFMVVCDAHESQGYALQEAMSCDVPLLVCDVTSMHQEFNGGHFVYRDKGHFKLLATSVSWWSEECGLRITDLAEVDSALTRMRETWATYTPRQFVVRNLSDAVCMGRILDHFGLRKTG